MASVSRVEPQTTGNERETQRRVGPSREAKQAVMAAKAAADAVVQSFPG
jgi:hypothetical protein